MTTSFTMNKPDDFHVHLREGEALTTTTQHTASVFARALIMPNLHEPVDSVTRCEAYKKNILATLPATHSFKPLFALYLTQHLTQKTLYDAAKNPAIVAVKWYPGQHTTGSSHGILDEKLLMPILKTIEELNLILCVHAETAGPNVDAFDREKHFISNTLSPLKDRFPNLKIVVEHVTNASTIDWIKQSGPTVGGTLTAHHLWINRNDIINSTIQPHYFCLPVAKRRADQSALIQAAISGNPQFFLGTDSAPHSINNKEATHGCAGIYTAHAALPLYAHIFEAHNALERLNFFASRAGAQFYGLPMSDETITLKKKSWRIPDHYPLGSKRVVPFYAGQTLDWQVTDD
jgi:dihydroorotase